MTEMEGYIHNEEKQSKRVENITNKNYRIMIYFHANFKS
jgi:hypothetical protein